eukprot:6206906-Pleurochrysis_carterae.AAC.3
MAHVAVLASAAHKKFGKKDERLSPLPPQLTSTAHLAIAPTLTSCPTGNFGGIDENAADDQGEQTDPSLDYAVSATTINMGAGTGGAAGYDVKRTAEPAKCCRGAIILDTAYVKWERKGNRTGALKHGDCTNLDEAMPRYPSCCAHTFNLGVTDEATATRLLRQVRQQRVRDARERCEAATPTTAAPMTRPQPSSAPARPVTLSAKADEAAAKAQINPAAPSYQAKLCRLDITESSAPNPQVPVPTTNASNRTVRRPHRSFRPQSWSSPSGVRGRKSARL